MNKYSRNNNKSIAVLLPARNAEEYLREAIESILSQTFENFQLIVVDDASTDSTWSIIKRFNDSRIMRIKLAESKGIVNALNVALRASDSEFVARIDADDIARNDRFEKQVEFLRSHPEVGVCGSSIKMIRGGHSCYVRYPECHNEIVSSLMVYKRSICHPTVMMRRSVLNLHQLQYTDNYRHAEDLFLWHELAHKTKFHNLREPLLAYRVHTEQVSSRFKEEQTIQTRALLMRSLPNYLPSLCSHTCQDLLNLVIFEADKKGDQINLPSLYARMNAINRADNLAAPAIFNEALLCKFLETVFKRNLGLRNTLFVVLTVLCKKPKLLINDLGRALMHIRVYLNSNWAK